MIRSAAFFSAGLLLLSLGCEGTSVDPPDEPLTDPCAPGAPRPSQDSARKLSLDGVERSFQLHVPEGYDGSPTPLVFNFHGFGSNAVQQSVVSEMIESADAEGFLVVHADGTGDPQAWNAGACCTPAGSPIDDVAFTAAMIDAVSALACVDPKRVYATGLSNGGFLSHRLACELSDRIAAIAPVAGGNLLADCAPSRPVPVIHFHGTEDGVVPFGGNALLGFPPVPETIADWAARNGCTGAPVQTFLNGDSHCETFESCAAGSEVTLCTVEGGGHTWPGGLPVPSLGHTTQDLSANEAMWSFFLEHPLP